MKNVIKSLALLKVTLDHHPNIHDYLDIFVPFLTSLIKKRNITDLRDIGKICNAFEEEYGLKIPYHPMLSLVNKAISKGYGTEVSKGIFVPVLDKINTDEFSQLSFEHERNFKILFSKYIEFCSSKHQISLSEEEVSNHFLLLLKEHDIDIMFAHDEGETILPQVTESTTGINLAYDFLRTIYEKDRTTFQIFADIAFGHIIASSILFNYKNSTNPPKAAVNFFIDTGILFGLSGINGEYEKSVYEELLRLLKANGGKILVFAHTVEEFLNIIEGCKYWIDNPNYDPYKANRALICFKSWGYHVSDIDLFISRFPKLLTTYGIEQVNRPDPNIDNNYQLSEIEFQNTLVEIYRKSDPYFDEEEKESTIYLDVQSVSSIYKLRKGRHPRTIEECGVLFITRNSSLAYASKLFEKRIDPVERFYIPTTVTDVFIGTILWLRSPISTDIQSIFNKRLIANCYAALQPTKQIRKLFLAEVEKVEKEKLLSADEITLLRTSNVAMELLQETTLGDRSKITSQTPIEIMDEIRAREKKMAREELESAKKIFEEKERLTSSSLAEKDQEIKRKQQEIDDRNAALKKANEERKALVLSITKKVQNRANIITWFVFGIFVVIVVVIQLIDSDVIKLQVNSPILIGGKIFFIIISLLNLLANFNFLKIKQRYFAFIVKKELKSYGIEPHEDATNGEED